MAKSRRRKGHSPALFLAAFFCSAAGVLSFAAAGRTEAGFWGSAALKMPGNAAGAVFAGAGVQAGDGGLSAGDAEPAQMMGSFPEEGAHAADAEREDAGAGTEKGETETAEAKSEPVIEITRGGVTLKRSLEDYLPGVVACQMPDGITEPAVWQCQAVIARTYLLSLILGRQNVREEELDLSSPGTYDPALSPEGGMAEKLLLAEQAVRATAGMALKYGNGYLVPLFHEMSAGKTRSGGEEFPYLAVVSCPSDPLREDFSQTVSFSWEDFAARMGLEKAGAGMLPGTVQIVKRDAAGYVEQMQAGGKSFTGDEARFSLGLSSSCFFVREEGGQIVFTVRGRGHGYGLSQTAAQNLAKDGASFDEILETFYPGSELSEE